MISEDELHNLLDYIERNAESIYVRVEVAGRVGTCRLTEVSVRQALHFAFIWIKQQPMLPPPNHPDAPKFWRYEQGGKLVPAVENYLNGKQLNRDELTLIKAYLQQWIASPVWHGGPAVSELRKQMENSQTQQELSSCISRMTELGMDPL